MGLGIAAAAGDRCGQGSCRTDPQGLANGALAINYYKRHLGDYAVDTGHLSFAEHGCYNKMLDRYYITEAPLPSDLDALCRVLGAKNNKEKSTVAIISAEFFSKVGDVLRHKRVDEELWQYQAQAASNTLIAKAREEQKRARNAAQTEHEPLHEVSTNRARSEHADSLRYKELREPSHKPLANSHKPEEEKEKRARKRASRLPEAQTLTPEWEAEAKRVATESGLPALPIAGEFAKFCDHWRAQPGQRGVKDDWLATWRNWVRKAIEFAPRGNGHAAEKTDAEWIDEVMEFAANKNREKTLVRG